MPRLTMNSNKAYLSDCVSHILFPIKLHNLWSNLWKYEQVCDISINLPLNKSYMGEV